MSETKPQVLIVDDDGDIQLVTKMSLKSVRYKDQRLKLHFASSGEDAVSTMKENPGIGVILIDSVMETESAGVDASRQIREDLGNSKVRIYLRSGKAPDPKAIEGIDIEYLPKEDLTAKQMGDVVLEALTAFEGS